MSDEIIKITIDDKAVRDLLSQLVARGENLSPVMKKIAGIMADSVEENFAQQGRPKWLPLSPSTIKSREKKGYWPGKILQMRGELAASVSRSFGPNFAAVGSNKAYAAIHQFGGQAGRGHKVTIPARPWLTLGNDNLEDIRLALLWYIVSGKA